jgi:hypothetical protein
VRVGSIEGGTVESENKDRVASLAALYAAERTDVQGSFKNSLQLVSVLVGFSALVGTIVVRNGDLPSWLYPLLPIPVWAAVGFHALINSLVFTHNQSVDLLEKELLELAKVSDADKTWVGAMGGRLVTDFDLLVTGRRWSLLAVSVMAYFGTGITVAGFTFASVFAGARHGLPWYYWVPMTAVYVALAVALYFAWRTIFDISPSALRTWGLDTEKAKKEAEAKERAAGDAAGNDNAPPTSPPPTE